MLISRICSVFCATLYSRATYLSPHQFFTVRYRCDENKRHWSIDRQARQPEIYNTHCPYNRMRTRRPMLHRGCRDSVPAARDVLTTIRTMKMKFYLSLLA